MTIPVLISTYTRIDHLKQTINALLKNELAKETVVYIYSDGARVGDEKKVESVRQYLSSVTGFSALHVVVREQNMGANANQINAMKELLDRYGAVITMEDDIVVAPGFLQYMNMALEKYKTDQKVFSISAYCPPIQIRKDYPYDAFFIRRFNGWGAGWWKDRFDSMRYITLSEFEKFSSDKKATRSFTRAGGRDMLVMLKRVAHGELDAGDVRCMYTQFLKDQYTLYPTQSLVQNIGFDGTGVHCGSMNLFEVTLSDKTSFRLPSQVFVDQRIVKAYRNFRNNLFQPPSYTSRVIWKVRGKLGRLIRICAHYFKTSANR